MTRVMSAFKPSFAVFLFGVALIWSMTSVLIPQ
jgi:hypothetical protein